MRTRAFHPADVGTPMGYAGRRAEVKRLSARGSRACPFSATCALGFPSIMMTIGSLCGSVCRVTNVSGLAVHIGSGGKAEHASDLSPIDA